MSERYRTRPLLDGWGKNCETQHDQDYLNHPPKRHHHSCHLQDKRAIHNQNHLHNIDPCTNCRYRTTSKNLKQSFWKQTAHSNNWHTWHNHQNYYPPPRKKYLRQQHYDQCDNDRRCRVPVHNKQRQNHKPPFLFCSSHNDQPLIVTAIISPSAPPTRPLSLRRQ